MGKYVPDRDFINEIPTEKRFRELLVEYNENIKKFEQKDSRAAGVRARLNLLEIYKLIRTRRREILERSKWLQEQWHLDRS